jgi:hypothetical protein
MAAEEDNEKYDIVVCVDYLAGQPHEEWHLPPYPPYPEHCDVDGLPEPADPKEC